MAEHLKARRQTEPGLVSAVVCDRCRHKKIKCDGAGPCSNCRRANLPCETRARLTKQAAPRAYVHYLEERVRKLEGERDSSWSPQASDSKNSPYGEAHQKSNDSLSSDEHPKKRSLPDWTVLKELGTQVIDEDGYTRYMGPSSGVGFSAKILEEILGEDQPQDSDYYCLFSQDDFSRSRSLEGADHLLWEVKPTNLPDKEAADKVINDFFIFTERVFPILHKQTFCQTIEDLYNAEEIGPEWFERLAQFYFVLSIGHSFNWRMSYEERTDQQIRGLQTGVRCFYATLHTRSDGLTRLQSISLQSYCLVLLRQRSEALRLSAMANNKALECGLHHDGQQSAGNPLETEMRRRIFWCVFMLHLFNSTLAGLPRALHEADITVAEPSDIDDEQLTTTAVLQAVPGRTKIHRFVSICRLVRILSRTLDVLYTHNKRKQASTRIEQMNRLCCEHLLDQLDFDFDETPDDIPHPDTEDPAELAILASFANEQLLYHYIRWLIHRPGLALSHRDAQFGPSMQICTEAAGQMLRVTDMYKHTLLLIKANPAAHPCTIFIASLAPLYRATLSKGSPGSVYLLRNSPNNDKQACRHAVDALARFSYSHSDTVRRTVLENLISRVFGDDKPDAEQQPSGDQGSSEQQQQHSTGEQQLSEEPQLLQAAEQTDNYSFDSMDQTFSGSVFTGAELPFMPMASHEHMPMDYQEQQLAHFASHEDLQFLVHDAFSPNTDTWLGGNTFQMPNGYGAA